MQPNNPPDNELASNELELSDGERAALDEGKDAAAAAAPAATDEKTPEQLQAEEAAAAEAAASGGAAAPGADAGAAPAAAQPAATTAPAAPFVPTYQVDDRNFTAELEDVNGKLTALKAAYKEGNVDDEAYETQYEALQEQKTSIRIDQTSAKQAADFNQQNQDQQWAYLQRQFLSLPENATLAGNPLLFAAWETAMQVVVDEAAKDGKALTDWDLLSQARQKLVDGGMMGAAAARPEPAAAAAAAATPPEKPNRQAPLKDVPATLSATPAAADALARSTADQLSDDGDIEDIEEKLAGMSEAARDRLLAGVPGGFVDN